MAIEKIINIKVNDGELQDLDNDLKSVASGFDKVDNSAQKTSKSVDDVAKNGGAIAVLDRLTGGLATQFKDAYEASKLFSVSLKGLRTAFIATGIGAFVVALGVIVAYWDEIQDYIQGTTKDLIRQQAELERYVNNLNNELTLLKKQEELLNLKGESTEEIRRLQEETLLLQQKANEELLSNLQIQLEREQIQVREVTRWEKIKLLAAQALGGVNEVARQAQDSVLGNEEQRVRLDELSKLIDESKQKRIDLEIELFKIRNPKTETQNIDNTVRGDVETVGGLSPLQEQELKTLSEFEDAKNEIRINGIQEELRLESLAADERMALEQSVANAKVGIAQNTLALISGIVEQDSALGKGVAVAQATISGIEGVQNAYTSAQKSPITTLFPAYPIVQAGLAGAFSALQIQKILSVDSTGRSTPNLGGGNVGGQSAPSFNVVGTSGVNQLAQTLNQDQQPIEAFVVASNVSGAQELNRNIVETATLG